MPFSDRSRQLSVAQIAIPTANVPWASNTSDSAVTSARGKEFVAAKVNVPVATLVHWQAPLHAGAPPRDDSAWIQPIHPTAAHATADTIPRVVDPSDRSTVGLYEQGRVAAMWRDPDNAVPFYMQAVAAVTEPPDPATLHVLSAMSGPLWNAQEIPTLVRLFEILAKYTIDESWRIRARFIHAEMLYELGRGADKSPNLEAAKMCRELLSDPAVHRLVPPVERAEFHFIAASALFQADRFEESLPHWQEAGKSPFYTTMAAQFRAHALAHLGREMEARAALDEWKEIGAVDAATVESVTSVLDIELKVAKESQ